MPNKGKIQDGAVCEEGLPLPSPPPGTCPAEGGGLMTESKFLNDCPSPESAVDDTNDTDEEVAVNAAPATPAMFVNDSLDEVVVNTDVGVLNKVSETFSSFTPKRDEDVTGNDSEDTEEVGNVDDREGGAVNDKGEDTGVGADINTNDEDDVDDVADDEVAVAVAANADVGVDKADASNKVVGKDKDEPIDKEFKEELATMLEDGK